MRLSTTGRGVSELQRKLGIGFSSGSNGWTWRSTTSDQSFGTAWFTQTSHAGVDLAAYLGWYWITRATTEGVRWLDELPASGRGKPDAHGWAYFIRGFLAVLQADPTAARPALARAVALAR